MCRVTQVKFDEGLQHNTHKTYHGKQWMFQSFCAQYHLTTFPAFEDTLMVFATYLDDHLQRHYATVHHYMVAIHAAHCLTPGELTSLTTDALSNSLPNSPSPSPIQTQADKVSPQSSFAKPGLYTGSTSPRTVCYGQP